MQDQRRESVRTPWGGIIAVAIGLLILGVVLLTPVKGWLNRIPNLWRIFYPLMALFAGYLVVSAFREDEGQLKALAVGKWAVLLAAFLQPWALGRGALYRRRGRPYRGRDLQPRRCR
jgi:hypothetical protein